MCGSRKYPYMILPPPPPPWKVTGNSYREEVIKANFLQERYEVKLEFPGGGGGLEGVKQKTICGGVWIFPGTTQCRTHAGLSFSVKNSVNFLCHSVLKSGIPNVLKSRF